ncbi:MAG: hypothetical protein LBB56_07830, partial [Chitinispirillales bacterium]|nr:hypothetical protein [Chitinispirillales bacterium]
MDGKSKKILNFIKKSGSELEALDVAFSLRMDEDAVLKMLKGLKDENLIVEKTDANGKVFYCAAAEQTGAEKRAKPNEAIDDDFEPKQKKEKAPRIITENEVLDIEDFSPNSAAAANVNFTEFVPPSPSPINQAAAAPVFQAPPPKMEKPVPPSPSPIKQTAPAAAAPVNVKSDEADIEDFTPKAAPKKSKVKEPVIDNDDDFEPKAKSSSPIAKQAIAAV